MRISLWWKTVAPAACLMAGVLAAGFLAITGPALAASAEETRVTMVDECVYSEWKYPARRKSAATACKCAAKKAMGTLSAEDRVDTGWGGGLTRKQSSAWKAALKTCR